MLLTDTDDLPDSVAAYMGTQTGTVEGIAIFGGTAAISDGVRDEVAGILGFAQPQARHDRRRIGAATAAPMREHAGHG